MYEGNKKTSCSQQAETVRWKVSNRLRLTVEFKSANVSCSRYGRLLASPLNVVLLKLAPFNQLVDRGVGLELCGGLHYFSK